MDASKLQQKCNSVVLQGLEGKPYVPIHADENYFLSLPAKYT